MRIQVSGRHVEVGEALRTRIEQDLSEGVAKYFQHGAEAHVSVGKDRIGFVVDVALHLDSGVDLQSEGAGPEAHGAFSDALEKIQKRVRRYTRRLKNHHQAAEERAKADARIERVPSFVLQGPEPDDGEGSSPAETGEGGTAPLVIAETVTRLETMSVSRAVQQLELRDVQALLFRNASHSGLNLVYRRSDGNIGWIDAEKGRSISS